jgi:hypothetical protein
MDFPVFLNKWIISNRFLRYRPIWWWYRLISDSGFRLDDYYVWKEFWMSLNQGYMDMNYKWEFEEFWGKGSYPPERIVVSKESYDALVERLNAPPDPEAQKRLKEILSKPAPWDDDYE